MNISARVDNSFRSHVVTLNTNGAARELTIPPRPDGVGSSANGGELLCLALATCYCNDLYREARKRGIEVDRVEVDVRHTDTVAEIQNTLRRPCPVVLAGMEASEVAR